MLQTNSPCFQDAISFQQVFGKLRAHERQAVDHDVDGGGPQRRVRHVAGLHAGRRAHQVEGAHRLRHAPRQRRRAAAHVRYQVGLRPDDKKNTFKLI